MTHVLFLLSHTEKGGGEVVIYNIVKHLDRSRIHPFVAHVDFRKGDFIHEFSELGAPPVDLRAGRLRNPWATSRVVCRIARFIRGNAVDVLFSSGAHNHIYAALARKIARVPVVTYVMNHYQPRLRNNPAIVRLALTLGADYYLAGSRTCLEPLERLIPKNIPREVMYHGVDPDFTSGPSDPARVRDQLGMANGQPLVSVIGRLQRWKGQDIFLRAAARVAATYPKARFAIVGGSLFGLEESYGGELGRLIDELGLRGRCWQVGHQSNVLEWMAASDIVIHAARTPEPGANVVMEAMALGRPVIASACGAPSEIIEDGVSGLLFEPENSKELAAKMLLLLGDPALKSALGQGAVSRIQSSFTAQHMSDRIAAIVESMSSSSVRSKVKSAEAPRTILFTLSSCRRAGHEMSVRNIIKVLDRTRFRPVAVFLCLDEDGSFPDELRQLGAEVIRRHIGRLRNPLSVLRTVRWLASLMKKRDVALVFSSGGHNHPYARLAALRAGCPIICNETFLFRSPFWRNGPIYTLNFLLGTDSYFSYGRLASETIRAADPWHSRVVYHPQMVDLSLFDYQITGAGFRRQMGIPRNAFVYAIVGRIQGWKGQDIFVQAALQIMKEFSNAYFVVAGGGWRESDRSLETVLKQIVVQHGAEQRILFTGFLPDSAPVFAGADVLCHCSRLPEPLGLVILEAFAMKKPVISVNRGGPLELVRAGVDGWLVPPDDVGSLVSTMKRCYEKRDHLMRMGEEGYQKVLSEHSESIFAKAMNDLIDQYAHVSQRVSSS